MLRGVGRRIHSEWQVALLLGVTQNVALQVALLLGVTQNVALQVVMEGVAEHLELESLAVKWLVRLRLSALSNLAEYKD